MRPLQRTEGAPVPLFDRLADEQPSVPAEPRPRRHMDLDGLADSVRREIETLLSTRCPWPEDRIDYDNRTVIDYGLVDLAAYFTNDIQDQRRMSQHIARTIAAYEPRLREVKVTVERQHLEVRALDVLIEGVLRFGTIVEPIAFPLRIEAGEKR